MPLQIPLRADLSSQVCTLTLDGASYQLGLHYNPRASAWSLDLHTIAGEPLLLGLRLVPQWSLLDRGSDPRLPPGRLYLHDRTGLSEPPTQAGLGDRWTLLYFPAEEG